MPHTASNLLVHFVFSTKGRLPVITSEVQDDLHAYLGGIAREIGGKALIVNGTSDHVHILVRIPTTRSNAEVVRLLKANSSKWVHQKWPQHTFAWQSGYGAFSVSESAVENVTSYIAHQQEHHKRFSFQDEFRAFLRKTISWWMSAIFGTKSSFAASRLAFLSGHPGLTPRALFWRRFAAQTVWHGIALRLKRCGRRRFALWQDAALRLKPYDTAPHCGSDRVARPRVPSRTVWHRRFAAQAI